MSDYGEEIINRTGNDNLIDKTNPMNIILNNSVGEWLQQKDNENFFEQFFLQDADGAYLDLHGNDFGVKRKLNESDEDYRQRIIYESLSNLTVNFLLDVYNVELYTFVDDFDVDDNYLTSDNPYFKENGVMASADTITKNILNKRFVIGAGITWL